MKKDSWYIFNYSSDWLRTVSPAELSSRHTRRNTHNYSLNGWDLIRVLVRSTIGGLSRNNRYVWYESFQIWRRNSESRHWIDVRTSGFDVQRWCTI